MRGRFGAKLGQLALLVGLLFPAPANAQREPPGTVDYVLWGSSTALLVVDWGQTHSLQAHGRTEGNVLLGPHPSPGAINGYFAGVLAANALVTRLHDRETRRILWAFLVGLELATVNQNRRVGVGWRFRW